MLQVEHLAKVYGARVVLRDVHCHFAPASVSLLAGGNGAGKSTLLRMVAGLARPTSGRIVFSGEPTMAYLGHATFLYPGLSALENLNFWNGAHGLKLSRQQLMALLEHVGLAAHAHERAGVFSRGMAQRLNLARVLMLQAGLLLLDEPGTGLDAASQQLLRQEIVRARDRGACVIVVSHDLHGDAAVADRLLMLRGGRLCHDGPMPRDLDDAGWQALLAPAGEEKTCSA